MTKKRVTLKLMFVTVIVGLFFFSVGDDADKCVTGRATRTFIQLYEKDRIKTEDDWEVSFKSLRKLGFNEIIVQWTSYDNTSYYDSPARKSVPYLNLVLNGAASQGFKIWLGLHYDKNFWDHLEKEDSDVEEYLSQRMLDLLADTDSLLASVEQTQAKKNAIAGWYISDEIDDENWQGIGRKKILVNYLKGVQGLLRAKRSHWPILVSGFSNGKLPSRALAKFWHEIATESGIDRVLFQDGIGAGKLTLPKLRQDLASFNDVFAGGKVGYGVIVEVFDIDLHAGEFATIPAPFERIAEQLNIANGGTTGVVSVFSAPDHITPVHNNKPNTLYEKWLSDRRSCTANYL